MFLLLLFFSLFLACNHKQVIVVNPNDSTATVKTDQSIETKPASDSVATSEQVPVIDYPSQVRILFAIRTDFPSGVTFPDIVYMSGSVLAENSMINTGKYSFSIEKRGYHKKTEEILVEDKDGDGNFVLKTTLEAKERVIIFDIRDQKAGDKVLLPDQVKIATIPDGQEQTLSDRSSLKPGRKKVVIQKQGYRPFSQEITLDPDEEPYILNSQLTPLE